MIRLPGLRPLVAARNVLNSLSNQLHAVQLSLGRIEARQTADVPVGALAEAEFKVSSQWGEDGIIEHLLRHVPVVNPTFIEFGVQDYVESNTRFLLEHRNWSGLVLDGSDDNIAKIKRDSIYWRHNLKAEAAFVTRDNINDIIRNQGLSGDVGLLSIDIDGNDYWVWEAIKVISPRIVIVEYNALFGAAAAVSVPYKSNFDRTRAHSSNLYWGCSLGALELLAARLGYVLVGCNSNGNNSFYVRADVVNGFTNMPAAEAFRPAKFRESRGPSGELTFLSPSEALSEIGDLPLVDVRTGKSTTVAQASGIPAAGV